MTPFNVIYSAFLAQIQDDEWSTWEEWEREEDWKQLLLAALPWFKFPRISLIIAVDEEDDTQKFLEELTNNEIQVIVAYMKYIWLSRIIDSTENLRPLYSERDFSPAMTLKQLESKQTSQLKNARLLESTYYRSIDGKPFPFSKLAGGK